MEEVISEEEIRQITLEVINKFVIPDFEERGHNASGNWIESIDVRAEHNKGIITGPAYTGALTDGRGPNKNQDPEAIANWAWWYGGNVFKPWSESKGLDLNPYAVAYTIAKRGTKIYREGGSDFLKILETQEVKDYIIQRISFMATANVKLMLKESLQKLKNS